MDKEMGYALIDIFLDKLEAAPLDPATREQIGWDLVQAIKQAEIRVAQGQYFANLEESEAAK